MATIWCRYCVLSSKCKAKERNVLKLIWSWLFVGISKSEYETFSHLLFITNSPLTCLPLLPIPPKHHSVNICAQSNHKTNRNVFKKLIIAVWLAADKSLIKNVTFLNSSFSSFDNLNKVVFCLFPTIITLHTSFEINLRKIENMAKFASAKINPRKNWSRENECPSDN